MGRYIISTAISRVTIIITHIMGLLTVLITSHESPSNAAMVVQFSFILLSSDSSG